MKGQVKSRESEYRRARLMTGRPPPPSLPPEDREILQIIPNEFVVDSNCFDSDSLFMKTIKQLGFSQIAETEAEVTLIPTVTNERIDIEKSAESSNPQADVEEIVVASPSLQSTPLKQSTYDTVLRSKNIKRKLYKPKNKQNQMMDNDYEQQLFLLAKKSKENQE
ncbi:hypothetical protein evm_010615 [Chilo suppressalis]|nr:hypothetical protein evm_010615 [Chilo suppressalis]